MAVALEREDVGRDPVEEPPIVADHDSAAGELLEPVLERAQGVDVEIVGRLVEQQHVTRALDHLRQVDAVALAAGQDADALLLVLALEVEARDVRPRVDRLLPDHDRLDALADLLVKRRVGRERVAALVDVAELDRVTDLDLAGVRLLEPHDHAEQRGLARAVGPDDPDDAAAGQRERQVVDQLAIAVRLAHSCIRSMRQSPALE